MPALSKSERWPDIYNFRNSSLFLLVWQFCVILSWESVSCFTDFFFFSLPQLLRSTTACFNETTFVITDCSCGLAAGLDSIGFSENRSAKWLCGICSVRCKMCGICLSLKIYCSYWSSLVSSLTVRRVPYLSVLSR